MTNQALTKRLSALAPAAPVVLRLALAAVMFPHGAQKALGWFGGYGWSGTMGFLTGNAGLPSPVAAGVILLEFLGPVLLAIGLASRAVALGFVGLMFGAIATVHAPHGFFMNWSGNQKGEGFEYHILVIGLAAAIALIGSGPLSADAAIVRRREA